MFFLHTSTNKLSNNVDACVIGRFSLISLTLYLSVFLKWNMVFKSSYLHIIQSFSILLTYNNIQSALNCITFLI